MNLLGLITRKIVTPPTQIVYASKKYEADFTVILLKKTTTGYKLKYNLRNRLNIVIDADTVATFITRSEAVKTAWECLIELSMSGRRGVLIIGKPGILAYLTDQVLSRGVVVDDYDNGNIAVDEVISYLASVGW